MCNECYPILIMKREHKLVLLSFLWLFTLMTGYYIVKPLREALTNELPHEWVPYLGIGVMVFIIFFNFIYDRLACIQNPERLIKIVTVFFSLCLLLFALILRVSWPQINIPFLGIQPARYLWIITYYFFVGIYNVFTVTMFWSFINDIFNSNEARTYFGKITAGGTIGGLAGSYLTASLSTRIEVENLLFLSSFLLMITIAFMHLLLPLRDRDMDKQEKTSEHETGESGFSLIVQSRYLQWMVLAAFLMSSGATVLYNQMNAIVKYSIIDKGLRTEFWAEMNLWINGLGLFFQIFCVHRAVKYLGMVTTILIAPVVNLTGSSFLIGSRSLMCGSIYHAGNYSTEYSFNRASREILYIPTDKDFKYQGKAIVETFVCRLGDGLTSLLLILTGLPLHSMSFLNLFISILRFIPAIALAGHYKTMIKKEKDIA